MSLWGFPTHLKCGPTQPAGGHLMGLKKGASLLDICVAATWSFGLTFTGFCCLNVAASPSFGERVLVLSSNFYLQGRPTVLQFDHSSLLCCGRALTRPACMYVCIFLNSSFDNTVVTGCGLHHLLAGNMEYVTEWREPLRFSLRVQSALFQI